MKKRGLLAFCSFLMASLAQAQLEKMRRKASGFWNLEPNAAFPNWGHTLTSVSFLFYFRSPPFSVCYFASLEQNLKQLEAKPRYCEKRKRGGRGGAAMEALLELEKMQRVLSLMSSRGLSHTDSSCGGAAADRFLAQFLLFMVRFLGVAPLPPYDRIYEFNRILTSAPKQAKWIFPLCFYMTRTVSSIA